MDEDEGRHDAVTASAKPGSGDPELGRIWMRSRRGLRELDLLLLPFVEDVLPALSAAERACYLELIEREDMELFAWLTLRAAPSSPALRAMIDRIRSARRPAS